MWRTLWYREPGSPTSFGRLQQAEHEAFLTLLAAQAGIRSDRVVTASATPGNDVVLVLRQVGVDLGNVPDRWTEQVARHAWRVLDRLHAGGIAHGQLDEHHVILDGDQVGLVDFRGAAVAPTPERVRTDDAQLLITTVLALGVEAALTVAMDERGPDVIGEALPFVQAIALTPRQRRAVGDAGLDLGDVRARAALRAGMPAPDLQRMRRVTTRSLVQVALLVVASVALASGIAGLDLELLAEQVRDATWWLVVVGALIAQAPRLSDAVSVMGASPTPIPLRPLYALQLATSYISLAVPTNAARIAVNIRFFQRHGLPPGSALAIGALDGVSQFVVQLSLLLGILLLSPISLDLSLGTGAPSGLEALVLLAVAAAVVSVLTIALVPRWRRAVVRWIRRLLGEARYAVTGLDSPRRLAMLIGGNLTTQLLFAFSLQTFARSLGYQVGLAELVLINVSVSLLSGLVPIPGGIGVVEGGLAYGLVRAGMPEETAFAAVLLYRLATFYLPPIWGFFALRWLERTEQL